MPNFHFTCNFHNFCPATGKGKCWKCVAQNISRGKGTDDFATIQGFCAKSVKAIFKTPAKSSRGLFLRPIFSVPNFRIAFRFATFAPQRAMSNAGNVRYKTFVVAVKTVFALLKCPSLLHFWSKPKRVVPASQEYGQPYALFFSVQRA